VVAVTSRVEVPGMITTGRRTSGALVVGVEDDATEGRVSLLPRSLKEGTWLAASEAEPRRPPMLLGSRVAKNLEVKVGDTVNFSSQDANGTVFVRIFVVAGTRRGSTGSTRRWRLSASGTRSSSSGWATVSIGSSVCSRTSSGLMGSRARRSRRIFA
jgi:hypothetical protein